MKSTLVYYYDAEMTKKASMNGEGYAIIDWGETKPSQQKEKVLYVRNESHDGLLVHQLHPTDEASKISYFPVTLMERESDKASLVFTPHSGRIKSSSAEWDFDIVGNYNKVRLAKNG